MLLFLQLRVVKAFRSSLDEFDEKRSIASTQSCSSMRGAAGGTAGWSYLSLSAAAGSNLQGRAASLAGTNSNYSQPRCTMVTLVQRANVPQPYPYYHAQQARSAPNHVQQNTLENNLLLAAGGSTNNGGRGCGDVIILSESSPPPPPPNMAYEKVPLVQRWRPSRGSGSSYAQRIGKSISLDTPVSIAHV